VRGAHKVRGSGLEDIGHEGLRIAVDEGEPAGLHLDHDAVAALEGVEDIVDREVHGRRLARGERQRLSYAAPRRCPTRARTNADRRR